MTKPECFLDFFIAIKCMFSLSSLSHRNERFCYLFIYFNQRNPYLFIYLTPENRTPFKGNTPMCTFQNKDIKQDISYKDNTCEIGKERKSEKLSCKNSYLLLLQNILNSVQTVKKFIVHCTLWKEYPSSNLALHSSFVDNA